MSFHTKLLMHTEEEVIRLLKTSNLTSEYHRDQVLSILHPNTITTFLYTTRPDTMEQYLAENGFERKTGKDLDVITMVYKDIVNIKIIADRTKYDAEKARNYEIKSITIRHVIKQMIKNGFSVSQLYTNLEKLATYK